MSYYLPYFIFGGLALLVVLIAVLSFTRRHKIQKYGVETDAVISRVSRSERTDSDGRSDTYYTYYVTFTAQDGRTVEAMLDTEPSDTRIGARVRIKYLPEKPKNVILLR